MKRRWPLRLIQASPLIALALVVGLWLSVLPKTRNVTLSYLFMERFVQDSDFVSPSIDLEILRSMDTKWDGSPDVYARRDGSLEYAVRSVEAKLRIDADRLYSGDTPLRAPLQPDDDTLSALREHLSLTGGQAVALVVPIDPAPPVAYAADGTENLLKSGERQELEASGTLQALRTELARANRRTLPLTVNVEMVNASEGSLVGDRFITSGTRIIGGHFYEYYAITRDGGGQADILNTESWESLESSSAQDALRRLSEQTGAALYILGPLDGDPVPLIAPDSGSTAGDRRLVDEYLRRFSSAYGSYEYFPVPAGFSDRNLRYGRGALSRPIGGRLDGRPSVVLMVVAAYEDHPLVPLLWQEVGRTPLNVARVWIAANLPFLLAVLVVFFAAGLIASPLAFSYERRRMGEIEIEQERERLKREARKQVLDRLTTLSNDVDAVAARMSGGASRQVAHVSRDIDSTIGTLKEILGDTAGDES